MQTSDFVRQTGTQREPVEVPRDSCQYRQRGRHGETLGALCSGSAVPFHPGHLTFNIGVSPRTSASETGAQHEKIVQVLSPKLLGSSVTKSEVEKKDKSKGVKEKKNRKLSKQKPFSPEEDEVLRNAIQIGDINFVEIVKRWPETKVQFVNESES